MKTCWQSTAELFSPERQGGGLVSVGVGGGAEDGLPLRLGRVHAAGHLVRVARLAQRLKEFFYYHLLFFNRGQISLAVP